MHKDNNNKNPSTTCANWMISLALLLLSGKNKTIAFEHGRRRAGERWRVSDAIPCICLCGFHSKHVRVSILIISSGMRQIDWFAPISKWLQWFIFLSFFLFLHSHCPSARVHALFIWSMIALGAITDAGSMSLCRSRHFVVLMME